MLFILIGIVAIVFGFFGIVLAISGEKDNLKKYVGTEHQGLAAVLGTVSVLVGIVIVVFFL